MGIGLHAKYPLLYENRMTQSSATSRDKDPRDDFNRGGGLGEGGGDERLAARPILERYTQYQIQTHESLCRWTKRGFSNTKFCETTTDYLAKKVSALRRTFDGAHTVAASQHKQWPCLSTSSGRVSAHAVAVSRYTQWPCLGTRSGRVSAHAVAASQHTQWPCLSTRSGRVSAHAVAVSQHMVRERDLRQGFYLLRKVVMPFIYKK